MLSCSGIKRNIEAKVKISDCTGLPKTTMPYIDEMKFHMKEICDESFLTRFGRVMTFF